MYFSSSHIFCGHMSANRTIDFLRAILACARVRSIRGESDTVACICVYVHERCRYLTSLNTSPDMNLSRREKCLQDA